MNAPPRIALLYWSYADDFAYCADLLEFFRSLERNGEIRLQILGRTKTRDPQPDIGPPIEVVKSGHFDGYINLGIWRADYLADLYRLGRPIVSLDYQPHGVPVDAVTFSGQHAGSYVGKMLADTGHKEILFVSQFHRQRPTPEAAETLVEDPTSSDRRLGLLIGLVGSPVLFWSTFPWIFEDDELHNMNRRLRKMIETRGHPPSAVVCHDTRIAEKVRDILEEMHLKIPQDLSLITFFAPGKETGYKPPVRPISEMRYTWRDMAEAGWELLQGRLTGTVKLDAPQRHVELPARYVDGGTVRNRTHP